ncbi:alkaline phosphatase D family protein [Streptomyces sp. G1]|uniref:alkaline phosphatase D family protein n=1 Tax=Streptomyces sp. G1 TaxID=361572 RepID=UPI00202E68E7|nr:alkaline phosphatase D family protein [Streptomyces sp. G1]MCM1974012.1 alkaline phosphatase D family protein [Streptomyces sp. G1]
MALDVSIVWIGATTATTARVRARLTAAGSGTLLVADNEAMSGPVSFGPVASGDYNVLTFDVTGLEPGTRYWVVVDDGALNPSFKATFLTHPAAVGEPVSYMFGAAGDAGLTGVGDDSYITSAVSNNPVFETMAAQALAEDWVWFSHLGDLHYKNISTDDVAAFRTAYFQNFNFGNLVDDGARQGEFFRSVASTYIWDDHDFGGNDSNRTVASNPAANQAYRDVVPHYPLPGGSTGIYQSWQVGRVLYVATDSRSFRDPNSDPQGPSKTLLGTGQKAWMEALLTTAPDSGAEALVWQSSSRWIGGSDTYSSFEHERAELVQMFGDLGWLDRMIFMTADEHALSICSGPYNPYGRFPMFMFASMDSSYGSTNSTAIYDVGQRQGRQQYGTMRVTDSGRTIALTGTGYINGAVWKNYTKHVGVGGRVIALDYKAGHISAPFEPTPDDQQLRNEITAQRQDGGEATYARADGPKGSDTVGDYDASVTLTVADDDQLPSQASWRVHLGTVDEDRYPAITVDLRRNPDLAEQLATAAPGDLVTIDNPPRELPPDQIVQTVEGGTATISLEQWVAELNASPGSPWTVAQLAAPQVLVHEGFEEGLGEFTGDGGATLARTASPGVPPFGGSWSVEITPDGVTASGGALGPMTEAGTVIEGEDYTATCWVYSPAGWADLRIVLGFYDAAGSLVSTDLGSAVSVPAGQWTLLSLTSTAPAGASRLQPRAYHGDTPTAGDIWYADQVTVRETRATGYSGGPARPNRLDTSGSTLVTAVDADDTEFLVHTPPDGIFDRMPWIVSSGPADAPNLRPTHFPFDVRLGGETARVTACTPAVWDQFGRTAASSWGAADSGQTWTLVGSSADYSVGSGYGAVNQPSTGIAHLTLIPAPSADVDLYVDIATSVLASGSSLFAGPIVRAASNANFYMARVDFTTSAGIALTLRKRVANTESQLDAYTSPLTHTADTFYRVRLRVQGTDLRAKLWLASLPEPGGWHAEATDSSLTAADNVGTRSFANTGSTAVNPQIRFDNFHLPTHQRLTVTRHINTVATAHAAGTAVSLAQPAPLAL